MTEEPSSMGHTPEHLRQHLLLSTHADVVIGFKPNLAEGKP
jgi:hypothetical protein